ncbi:MAG: hypothetical protein R3F34_19215 [Planctomycetota bacterium]
MRDVIAGAAAAFLLLALASCASGTVETPFGTFGGADDDPARLDFLDPLVRNEWHRVVGEGADQLDLRSSGEVVLPGVALHLFTDSFTTNADGGREYVRVVDGTVGYDSRRDAFVYRAWTVDGSYMDGTVFPAADGDVVFDFDLTTTEGTLSLRQRYTFPREDLCRWVTMERGEDGRVFDVGEMRRAVPAASGGDAAP